MAAKFKKSYKGVGEMLCMPELQADMLARATRAMAYAESIAPVDEKSKHPGRYKAAFKVSSGIRKGRKKRAYGRLENLAPENLDVEYGTRNNPRHRVLGRSLQAMRDA